MARTVDELFRDAVLLRQLILDLDPEDHRGRERLLRARMELRAEAAAAWRLRGWRPITQADHDHARV